MKTFLGRSADEWLDIEDKARHYRAMSCLLMDKVDQLNLTIDMQEAHIEDLEHQVTQFKRQLGYDV